MQKTWQTLVLWAAMARMVRRVHVSLRSAEFHADREGVVQQRCHPQKHSPKGNKGEQPHTVSGCP